MENYLTTTSMYYNDIDEHKLDIDKTIEQMFISNERLIFAVVAEKAGITRFVIRQYPELRDYILKSILHYKEKKVIDEKIDKAVQRLLTSNKKLTFMSIINKCKFSSDIVYSNSYIKDKIRSVLAEKK